ncbi:MAG: single-stranded DNA-binding protein [Sphingobacteriia bacterium]|nr:single-stranded DNA-binding protein [Sphingobacteriia bacterium]
MPNHAQVTLVGHLGQDPATKQVGSDSVTEFSIATSRKRKDKNGDLHESTTWWRCAMWGKRGEVIARYLKKGDPILVSGEPHVRPWTDNAGAERQSLEVDVREFAFVGGRGEQSAPPQQRQQPERMDSQNRASMAAQAPSDFDIPFAAYERRWIA